MAGFLPFSLHSLFSKEFSSSLTELRSSSEKDNRGSEKPLVACQCCTVRLSFICQSKLVKPYQTARVKPKENDLFKRNINKNKFSTMNHLCRIVTKHHYIIHGKMQWHFKTSRFVQLSCEACKGMKSEVIPAASAGVSAEPSLSKQGHSRCNRYNRSVTVWGRCESALAADAISLPYRATRSSVWKCLKAHVQIF